MPLSDFAEKVSGGVIFENQSYYDFLCVSGALASGQTFNITSGKTWLHTVSLGTMTSDGRFVVMDSCSGLGKIVAEMRVYDRVSIPTTLVYDVVLYSGLVVMSSGTANIVTISYKQ